MKFATILAVVALMAAGAAGFGYWEKAQDPGPIPEPLELSVGYSIVNGGQYVFKCGVIPLESCYRTYWKIDPMEKAAMGYFSIEDRYWDRYNAEHPVAYSLACGHDAYGEVECQWQWVNKHKGSGQ